MTRTVTLYVDPTCPFAWITSRWLLNATAASEEFEPELRIMSLSVLNEGRDLDPGYMEAMDRAWDPARLALAIQKDLDQKAFSDFYTAWGERFHVQGRKDDYLAVAKEALAEAGLDEDLAKVWGSTKLDQELRAEQAAVQEMVGDDVGTPVISFGEGVAYFGPVISPAPKGEIAVELLEAMATLATVPGFFELKRARTGGLDFS